MVGRWAICVALFVLSIPVADAASAPRAEGQVILTVDGAISNHGSDGAARFTLQELKALGVRKIVTSTPWTDGVKTFEGVLVRSLLKRVGAHGRHVKASALDGYFSVIPIKDFYDYDVILAFSMDGKRLTRRDKGPLWIVYPWDAYPKIVIGAKSVNSVWLLRKLTVQ